MRAHVDEKCISCGLCRSICGGVFSMGEDKAEAIIGEIPTVYEEKVKEARDSCPVDAIDIEM